MLNNSIFDSEKLSIETIEIVGAQIHTPKSLKISEIEGFTVENNLQIGSNLDEKLIKADLSVNINTQNKLNANATVKSQLIIIFKVGNLTDLSYIDDNKVMLHHELTNAIAAITYNTARGVLISRLQTTIFKDFILPNINTNKLLEGLSC